MSDERVIVTGEAVVASLPIRTDADWWWASCRPTEIRFIRGRIRGTPAAVVIVGSGRTEKVAR